MSDPRTWLDRLVGACFGVLAGTVALYVAVQLIQAVWVVLVIVLAVVVVLAAAVAIIRSRHQGW